MSEPSASAELDRVLVTGGHGFVGRHVVAQLAADGTEVVCPHRPGSEPPPDTPGTHVPRDLRREPVDDLLDGVDAVVHLAARAGGIQLQEAEQVELFRDNQAITASVLGSAQRRGVRRIFLASSAVVYAPSDASAISESAPLVSPSHDRVTGYAWSKITDELVARWLAESGALAPIVGRFTNVYGPGASFDPAASTVVHSLVRKALDAGPERRLDVWGDGRAVRSFVFVRDAARAVVTLLRRGAPGGIYNIDSSEAVTIAQLATIVRDVVDPGLALAFDASRPQGSPRRVLDTTALRALGYVPETPLEDGVRAVVAAASRRPGS